MTKLCDIWVGDRRFRKNKIAEIRAYFTGPSQSCGVYVTDLSPGEVARGLRALAAYIENAIVDEPNNPKGRHNKLPE